jgi:hypothetical protein
LWLPLLAPRWGKVHRDAEMTQAAWEHLLADYLRPERPSLLACYKRVLAHAEQYHWQVPSYDAVVRRVNHPGLKAGACPCTTQPGIPDAVPGL